MDAYRKFLHSKIHRATVTHADLQYEGSLTIPPRLMLAAKLLDYEAIQIWNVTSGTRLETYAITGLDDCSICANGAAATAHRFGSFAMPHTSTRMKWPKPRYAPSPLRRANDSSVRSVTKQSSSPCSVSGCSPSCVTELQRLAEGVGFEPTGVLTGPKLGASVRRW